MAWLSKKGYTLEETNHGRPIKSGLEKMSEFAHQIVILRGQGSHLVTYNKGLNVLTAAETEKRKAKVQLETKAQS